MRRVLFTCNRCQPPACAGPHFSLIVAIVAPWPAVADYADQFVSGVHRTSSRTLPHFLLCTRRWRAGLPLGVSSPIPFMGPSKEVIGLDLRPFPGMHTSIPRCTRHRILIPRYTAITRVETIGLPTAIQTLSALIDDSQTGGARPHATTPCP